MSKKSRKPRPGGTRSASRLQTRQLGLDEAMAIALKHLQSGRAGQAATIFRDILSKLPDHPHARHYLGLALLEQGDPAGALEHVLASLEGKPDATVYHTNLAVLLGRAKLWAGQVEALARLARRAPGEVEAWRNLGRAALAAGLAERAIDAAERGLAIAEDADLLHLLGAALRSAKRYDAAIEPLQRAVGQKPTSAQIRNDLGVTLFDAGRIDDALATYDEALAIRDDLPELHNNIGNARAARGEYDAAAAAFARAVELQGDYAQAWMNWGNTLRKQGRLAQAEAKLARAVELDPGDALCHNGLGCVYLETDRVDEALARFDKALSLSPDEPGPHFNRSQALLLRGRFAPGWAEYEWRSRSHDALAGRRQFDSPRWAGEDPAGMRVLLHHEQGYGDMIQFVRYARWLQRRGATVIVEALDPLVRLFRSAEGVDEVFAYRSEPPAHDAHLPMMSLPGLHRTTFENFPPGPPYLAAEAELAEQWTCRLGPTDRLRVGLVWTSNPRNRLAIRKSIPAGLLDPLWRVDGVEWVSLMVGPDAPKAVAGTPARDVSEHLVDFAQTAAAIANLDLVVSVDTAVCHLAGAMDRPVWTLLTVGADWRWFDDAQSRWYPSMRLWRQADLGDWGELLTRVSAGLAVWRDDRPRPE